MKNYEEVVGIDVSKKTLDAYVFVYDFVACLSTKVSK